MRNYWLNAVVDGRKSPLSGGPRAKDGGFSLSVRRRDEGTSQLALRVHGDADDDGTLRIRVYDENNALVHTSETKR